MHPGTLGIPTRMKRHMRRLGMRGQTRSKSTSPGIHRLSLTYTSVVPVIAIGFGDLENRVKQQQNQVYAYRNVLHTILQKLDTLQQKHDLATSIKLEDCRRRHIALARRALSLAAQVQVIKNRGYALHPEEEEMKKKLESLSKKVNDPQINGKVNEIWARMTMVRERARQMSDDVSGPVIEWDEKQLKITSEVRLSSFALS